METMMGAGSVVEDHKPSETRRSDSAAIRWLPVPVRGAAVLITWLPEGEPKFTTLEREIGVTEAAELLGKSKRRVQAMCDEGVLVEGRDWRKSAALGPNGTYLIRFEAVMRLRENR